MTRFDDLYAQFGLPAQEYVFGETVIYRSRQTNSSGDAAEFELFNVTARRMEQSLNDQPLGSTGANVAPILWKIAASVFSAANYSPQRGDWIEDSDGTIWSIDGWKQTGMQADYEFTCKLGRD